MKIKVCGMKDPQNIRELAALMPDYMGFIFYPCSPRYAGMLDSSIVRALPAGIKRIGVFVNETINEIKIKVEEYGFDFVQLHGDESPEMCGKVTKFCPVIKAVNIFSKEDIITAKAKYHDVSEYLLFDTKTGQFGGSGRKFDWNVLNAYNGVQKFFLSGGISPEDSGKLNSMAFEGLHCLDVNSRFEISPGVKDIDKLRIFINEIRNEQNKQFI